MGRYTVHVVGESNYQPAIRRLREGTPIDLVPEPGNPYDPRAIRVDAPGGQTIGYVPRDSWLQAALLDQGTAMRASVMEIMGGEPGKPSLGVVLEVLTAKEAMKPGAAPRRVQPARLPQPAPPPRQVAPGSGGPVTREEISDGLQAFAGWWRDPG